MRISHVCAFIIAAATVSSTALDASAQPTCTAPTFTTNPSISSCAQGAEISGENAYWAAFLVQDNSSSTLYGTPNAALVATTQYGWAVDAEAVYSGDGVWATSDSGTAVNAGSTSGVGVWGSSSSSIGVYGVAEGGSTDASGPYGVYGSNNSGDAIYGYYNGSSTGAGVVGTTGSTSGFGVYGQNTAAGVGVYGSGGLYGVQGVNPSSSGHSIGVYGESGASGGWAIYGYGNTNATGVFGDNRNATSGGNAAVNGQTGDGGGYGGYFINAGTTGNGYAGYFSSQYGTGIYVTGGGTDVAVFNGDIKVNSTTYSSDARLKKNIEPLGGALEKLLALKGVTFDWREPEKHGNHSETQTGFIAQDVEKVFPGWVKNDNDGYKTLDTHQIEALEVEAIRQLKAENDELRGLVQTLSNGGHPAPAGIARIVTPSCAGWGAAGIMFGLMMASRRKKQA